MFRKRAVRRVAVGAAVLGVLALVDQSLVRAWSAPRCRTCALVVAETTWSLNIPVVGIEVPLSAASSPRGTSPVAEWLRPGHEHDLQRKIVDFRRGVVVAEVFSFRYPGHVPDVGPFTRVLTDEPLFAAYVRAAVDRGDIAHADVAAAIAQIDGFGCREPPADELRARAVANRLYAAWRSVPAERTDLWNPGTDE